MVQPNSLIHCGQAPEAGTHEQESTRERDPGLDGTILIATCRRPEELRRTLEAMTRLDHEGLNYEIVIVDNAPTLEVGPVVDAFQGRLPLVLLHEPRSGKNCALNCALDHRPLGRWVIFTDDDVTPEPGWLKAWFDAARRWPGMDVLGGRIQALWPTPQPPVWAADPVIAGSFYGQLDLGDEECRYPAGRYPAGANFAVRREIFLAGHRFDERFGPTLVSRIEASEVSFLKMIEAAGHRLLYVPRAVLGHRIQPRQLTAGFVMRRAWQCGRTGPLLVGLSRQDIYQKIPWLWWLLRTGSLVRYLLLTALYSTWPGTRWRARAARALWGLANNWQQLQLACSRRPHGLGTPPVCAARPAVLKSTPRGEA